MSRKKFIKKADIVLSLTFFLMKINTELIVNKMRLNTLSATRKTGRIADGEYFRLGTLCGPHRQEPTNISKKMFFVVLKLNRKNMSRYY